MNKRKIHIVLGLIVILVWAAIIYRVFLFYNSGNKEETIIMNFTNTKFDELAFSKVPIKYMPIDKDPFVREVSKQIAPRVKKAEKSKKVFEDYLANFKIKGIIINPSSRLVILEDFSKNTIFLREGEKYMELKILKILDKEVIIEVSGKSIHKKF